MGQAPSEALGTGGRGNLIPHLQGTHNLWGNMQYQKVQYRGIGGVTDPLRVLPEVVNIV